jgi:hypothetical protein
MNVELEAKIDQLNNVIRDMEKEAKADAKRHE